MLRSADAWWTGYARYPLLWALPAIACAAGLLAPWLARRGRTATAFVLSSLAPAGVILTAAAAMFPFVMPSSTSPSSSLTVWDSTSSHLTLSLMFWATMIFVPLIVGYTSWAYRIMRGKVTAAHVEAGSHSLY